MRSRTLYGQLMATTSIVLGAVLVLSIAAYFVMNVLHAHDDTRHRMLLELPQLVTAVRRSGAAGAAGAAPTVRAAAEALDGGVSVYLRSGRRIAHAGTPAPRAYLATALHDLDLRPDHLTWHEVRLTGKNVLVALFPLYMAGGGALLIAMNAPIRPAPPTFREVVPILVAELLALLLAQVLWSLVIRRLTRPLEALAGWAGRLASGDLRARVEPTEAVAELRHLSDALHRMAESLASERDRREDFLAEVAHDLRTPLSVQRTLLEALATGQSTGRSVDVPRLARQAQAETERLIRLVNGLLDLARLESGQELTASDLLDLREPVAMEASTFEVHARQREVALAVELGASALLAVADADRVTQIATNLIDNAVRHAGRGGRVTVRTAPGADGRSVELSVTDSGPGVPEAVRRSMWQRFGGARERTSSTGGLGLAISRALARAMGGDLRLDEGAMTRFVLSLPRAPEAS